MNKPAKAMKKPAAVLAAEQALADKLAEIETARENMRRLEKELAQAYVDARKAREDADAALPQCEIVNLRYGKERDVSRAVILRKTPSGMLVARPVGNEFEYKFKFAKYIDAYVQAEKSYGYGGDRRQLRAVPAEFLPPPPTGENE